MCLLCVEELTGAAAVIAAALPFLKARLILLKRAIKNRQMRYRSAFGRWA